MLRGISEYSRLPFVILVLQTIKFTWGALISAPKVTGKTKCLSCPLDGRPVDEKCSFLNMDYR